MSLLSFCSVSFAYSCGSALFEGASFSVNPADRIAIVGPNGAGKSTLLRLIAGELEPARGEVVRRRPLLTAVADQEISFGLSSTLFDFVFEALGSLALLRKTIRELEGQLSDSRCAGDYANRINEYQERGGYAAEANVARILSGLRYSEEDFERDIRTLSGGERTRAGLARALSMESDVLILDEPTNHLDIGAREWLDAHLRTRQSATVLTSHDRTLLAGFATRVVEIERGKVRVFEGGFSDYRRSRDLLDRQAWDAYDAFERRSAAMEQAAGRREQLARRVAAMPEDGAGGSKPFYGRKAGKVARTGRILRERVNDEKRVDKPWQEQPIDGLTFERVVRSGDIVVSAHGLTKSYGGKTLFEDLRFTARRGDRLLIRGANGSGKTTLLNIILGRERPDSGTIHFGAKTQVASVDQLPDGMDLDRSPLEICGAETDARTLLACLKLRPDRVNRPLHELSGGERTKVALARVLGSGANLLLLDEPTNHLEIEAQEALEQALQRYPGTLIVVSHDRCFLESIGPESIYLDLGGTEHMVRAGTRQNAAIR
jgi:ATP-binding cassette, subfamily F, member 3